MSMYTYIMDGLLLHKYYFYHELVSWVGVPACTIFLLSQQYFPKTPFDPPRMCVYFLFKQQDMMWGEIVALICSEVHRPHRAPGLM